MVEQAAREYAAVPRAIVPTIVQPLTTLLARLHDERTRIVRFLVTGVGCAVLNVAIFDVVHRVFGVDYRIAVVVAYALSYVVSFLANRRWTFSAADGHAGRQGVRFVLVSAGTIVAALLATIVAVESLGIPAHLGEALSAVLAAPLAFALHRRFTFPAPVLAPG